MLSDREAHHRNIVRIWNRAWSADKIKAEVGSLIRPKGKAGGWQQGRGVDEEKNASRADLSEDFWACARASL